MCDFKPGRFARLGFFAPLKFYFRAQAKHPSCAALGLWIGWIVDQLKIRCQFHTAVGVGSVVRYDCFNCRSPRREI